VDRKDTMSGQCLLTAKSLSVSLAPPRAPPVQSSHHKLLLGKDPSTAPAAYHHEDAHNSKYTSHHARSTYYQRNAAFDAGRIRRRKYGDRNGSGDGDTRVRVDDDDETRLQKTLRRSYRQRHHRAHPHLPPVSEHRTTRFMGGRLLSTHLQNRLRDDGTLRAIFDGAAACSAPMLALTQLAGCREFLDLTRRVIEVTYAGEGGGGVGVSGENMQRLDLILPESGNGNGGELQRTGFVFFVVRRPFVVEIFLS